MATPSLTTAAPRSEFRLERLLLVVALAVFGWYAVRTAGQLVRGDIANNDFRVYYDAARDFAAGRDPYALTLRCCRDVVLNGGYDYPPLLAEALRPLAWLPFSVAGKAWFVLNQAFLAATMLITWRALRGHVRTSVLLALFSLTLVFRPLLVTVDLGQVNLLVAALLATAAFYYASRPGGVVAGGIVGIATVVKLLPGLLVVGFVRWNRRPRLLPGLAAFAVSVAAIGGGLWLLTPLTGEFFFKVLERFTSGPPVYGNESLQAVAQRGQILLLGGVHTPGKVATAVAMLALVGVTWWRGSRVEGYLGRLAVFASLLAVIPLVSSITWDHHLVPEMLALALVSPLLAPRSGRWWLAVGAYPLIWLPAFPWVVAFAALHAPRAATVLVAGSMPAVGETMLWLACLLALNPSVADGR